MVSVGSENAAIQVLTRAIQLDSENKYSEAVTCYEQGIRLLLECLKASKDEEKKKHFRKKIDEYLSRAEIMKKASLQEKELSKVHKQIHIKDNETGNSYETLFSFVISETLTSVEIEDAYIRSTHQIYNFLRFCELLVKKAPSLRNIILNTTYSPENLGSQKEKLAEIGRSLKTFNITLDVRYSDTLHDREIRLNNGWIIKIGRGLDYFKRPSGNFSIGFTDFDLRPCHETTIDIFHRNSVKNT
ncbi:UNVERIFIED_CONTAM: hypothetical protein RMT77_013071 [Armadillidium vulgare]